MNNEFHKSVLKKEIIDFIINKNKNKNSVFIDCTLGEGGHTEELLKKGYKVIGIEQDIEMLKIAKKRLEKYKNLIKIENKNFKDTLSIIKKLKLLEKVDGLILDLGISMNHFKKFKRGFSYTEADSILDMRLNLNQDFKAKDILNQYNKQELEKIFKEYSDIRPSKKIAEIIKNSKIKFLYVKDLINLLEKHNIKSNKIITLIFQALRIEVNNELENLKIILKDSIKILKKGGYGIVISFHSKEDRIVKNFIKSWGNELNKRERYYEKKFVDNINKSPIIPTEQELLDNRACKSAKLRIYTKF